MKGLTIINLYKHNIVHKNVKKFYQKKLLYSCMTFFIIAGTLLYLNQHNISIKKAVASATAFFLYDRSLIDANTVVITGKTCRVECKQAFA
jgi:hypothetical protein